MIPHYLLPEPDYFEEEIRQPGNEWLVDHPPPKRPRDYWSRCKPQLQDAFGWLCAYSAMYEPVGTVDHFISCDTDRTLSYEWNNYRFASQWINSSKKNARGILDPFNVGAGWFEVSLPSCQLVLTDAVPPGFRVIAQNTLNRLHLIHDERVVRQRRSWLREFENGMSLDMLRRMAPLIAVAVEKKDRQNQNTNQD